MKFHKYLLLMLAGILIIIGTAACSSSTEGNKDVTLNINYYTNGISDTVIENAKKEFPEYTLNFTELPADNNYDVKLRTSLNSDSGPDIAMINDNIQDFLPHSEKFINFLDYNTEELADQYVEWKWEAAKTADKERMIAMPTDIGPTALFYRADNFEAAGLPSDPKEVSETIVTSEDYMEAAKQMKEKIDKPMFISATELFGQEYRKLSEGMYNEEGELTLANGKLKDAWDYTVEAVQNGYTLGAESSSIDNVIADNEGLYGGYIGASWGVVDIKNAEESKGQWRIAKAPGGYSNQGGSFLSVLATTEYPDEAVKVVKFLTNYESQLISYQENGLFPVMKELYDTKEMENEDDFFGGQEINEYFSDAALNINYVYKDPRDSAAFRAFEDEINLVESKGKDPDEAWDDAVKKAEEL